MIEKEKKRSHMIQLKWEKRQELKKVVKDFSVDPEARSEAVSKLNRLPRNSSKTRARNRCAFTGRCRGYLRKFKMSRLCFREMAHKGNIPGVIKASW